MSEIKFKIGEFSRLSKVTVRALRHYEQIGLLVPEIVDRWTGYRYYTVTQFQKIQNICTLKTLGYTLEEIRDMMEDESHFPSVESRQAAHRQDDKRLQNSYRQRQLGWRGHKAARDPDRWPEGESN